VRASEIQAAAQALGGGSAPELSNARAATFLAAVARDLQAHRGRSLVIAGDYQPAAVHQAARQLNESLGNVGTTVTYAPTIELNPVDQAASLRDLVQAMEAGQVDLLVILGGNPGFTAPAELEFRERLGEGALAVSHPLHPGGAPLRCPWKVPAPPPARSGGRTR